MAKQANQFKPQAAPAKEKTRKKKKPERKKSNLHLPHFFTDGRFARIMGFFFVILAVYMALAFTSYLFTWQSDNDWLDKFLMQDFFNQNISVENWTGRLGAILSHMFIKRGVGIASYLILLVMLNAGLRLLTGRNFLPQGKTLRISVILILWLSVSLGFAFGNDSSLSILGGSFGYESSIWLIGLMGIPGTILLLVFFFISFLFIVRIIPAKFKRSKSDDITDEADIKEEEDGLKINNLKEDKYNTVEYSVRDDDEDFDIEKPRTVDFDDPSNTPQNNKKDENNSGKDIELTIEESIKEETKNKGTAIYGSVDSEFDPTLDLPHYKFPTLDLLNDYQTETVSVAKEELEQNKDRIVETLNNYAIRIDKIKATIGPTVTLYEIIPAPGVRISRIKNLEDDIALSLSAMGIRIIAPIPGKGTIGIEVPNLKPEIVSIKSMLASDKFRNSNFELPIAIGKTVSNESYIADLTKMPHILMAGATGQGKSVGLNAIILSLLYKKHPSQLKFVMVDPKKVELTLFSKIERHFLAKLPDSEEAIITDTRKVVRTLNSLGIEMDHRYELLKDAQVRNIKEYNTKFIARRLNPNEGHHFMPYIVVVVDEFADLIMTAGREIENPLTRLAQLARATGIHLIIATQRPSVNIITGTIKANFPARLAFRVISKVDSRTILDSSGADQLIGRGDMLMATGSDLVRLQCAFVDTPEVDKVTEFIGSQRGYPDAFALPEFYDEEGGKGNNDFDPNDRDELFEDAARIIVQHQQGSTSLLQRKLKLGYNRAGRLIDQLEAAGIVGPFEGSKAREVKVANEMALEQFLRDLNDK